MSWINLSDGHRMDLISSNVFDGLVAGMLASYLNSDTIMFYIYIYICVCYYQQFGEFPLHICTLSGIIKEGDLFGL